MSSRPNPALSEATIPNSPLQPNQTLVYIICIGLGFIFGIGILVVRYLTYNDITSASDLLKLLPSQVNFLGSVPLYKKKMKYSQVVVTESSKSRMAEVNKLSLRTENLLLLVAPIPETKL